MEIKVKYIKTPVEKIRVKRSEAGAKGGKVKTAKGFAKMDKERLRKLSVDAVNKRWGKK